MPILGSLIKTAYSLCQFPLDIATIHPGIEQRKVLKKLLTKAQNTAFGEHYQFEKILLSSDFTESFRKNIPIHDYRSMFNNWWYRSLNGEPYVAWPGKVKYFALTSGTSEAASKHIPVTPDMQRAIQKASIRQLVSATKYDFPVEFYEKGILMIGGSTHLQYNGTYYQGDLSGITAGNIPFWFQHFYKPGRRISREQEWSVKLNEIVRKAKDWDIGIVVGVPAWVQIMLEKIIAFYRISTIHDIWPNLSAYVHSGVSFDPYRNSFAPLFSRPILYNESYLASEGYIAFQRPGTSTGMELILDNGIFYEFIPYDDANFDSEGELKTNPETVTIDNVKEGIEYALLLTTCAGAWRYLIGDTIKFISKERNEIALTGRTKHFISLCGEHLSQDNMNRAIKMLQDELNIKINEFTVTGIRFGNLFAHKWYLGTDDPLDPDLAAEKLDSYLKILNDDYRVERIEAIKNVSVEVLPLQVFHHWMKAMGKEGGAHKFPRVLKNGQLEQWKKHIETFNIH
ncbi:MAG: GH3 auxin-responsive promoter family protein [Bacteroidales bacterium]|nr:GH3 auxin-responsive promoter family protein [Bacteroidales bacterium]MDD4602429.1 GH3 auxin-responsive promoter family protein [Bacteroidales bacterium]